MNDVNHLNWIPIGFAQPKPGQRIYGAAAAVMPNGVEYRFWHEEWDEDEPLGSMTHWQPAD